MKKNILIVLLGFALSLALISLLTLNSKKAKAETSVDDPVYSVGSTVADFSLKNYDGTEVSLASNSSAKGYILVFTCNECPFAKAYQSRIQSLHKKYAGLGYPVIAINPNSTGQSDGESIEANAKTAKEKGFGFAYLADTAQAQARLFGAKKTPTAYILHKTNNNFVIKYMGAIDDNAQDEAGVSNKYLENAMGELLVGRAVTTTSTKSVGCGIKWKTT